VKILFNIQYYMLSPQTATTLYETVDIDNISGVIGMSNRLLNEE